MTKTMTPAEAREFLTGFDHCRHSLALEYLNVALDRLLVTIDMMPELSGPVRVLELGSAPYFMTSLLLQRFPNYQMELANEPGRGKYDGGHVRLVNRDRGIDLSFDYKEFNIETDRFPYEDGHFDTVIYCEMIEHLMHDPSHSLYEIHRVLRPGGYLLLSTPNPFRYTNYLRFLAGTNIYPPFSGYGSYARHNREFSSKELKLLLKQCNYELEELITAYDPAYDHPQKLDRVARWLHKRGLLRDQMDVIHLRARAVGQSLYRYPPELYLDVHAYQRIVNDNIEMGVNDEAQLGVGFYKLECWPPHVRWTEGRAKAKLLANNRSALNVRLYSGPRELGRSVTGTVKVGSADNSFEVAPGEWADLRFPLPAATVGPVEVELKVDKPWIAHEVLGLSDTRPLGVAVQRIWLD